MKRLCLGVFFLFCAVSACFADLILHFQSPFRNDAATAGYFPHVLGGAGADFNPGFGAASKTIMSSDGDGWFTYIWEGKTIADFQDWMTFNIKACPNTDDVNYNFNNCVAWSAGEFKMGEFFGTETELWVYTEADGSYTKSFMAPGSKIVWFKSPWGNKVLPQMVFGADSVLMRFTPGDASKCGWFYGSVTPSMMAVNAPGSAYFVRYMAPWYSVPGKDETVDLSTLLASQDTVFVDGTVDTPVASASIGSAGECFDPTRRLHIYHPWRSNTSYRDSAFYITIGNNIMNQPTPVSNQDAYKYWRYVDFDDTLISSPQWNSNSAFFQILRGANDWPPYNYFKDGNIPLASSLFPAGIYETWLFSSTNMNVLDFVYYPLEPKVIRLMSPWDDMSPTMLVPSMGDTVKMGPLPMDRDRDTCGWYEGVYYKHVDDWGVYFKQTFGMEYYSVNGIEEDKGNLGTPISLDSMMALHDSVWVYPYPVSTSAPAFASSFPGRLGRCPTLKISAMVVDWAGEGFSNSIDVDFGNINNGNEYTAMFGYNKNGALDTLKTCSGLAQGMVRDTLVNGLPARVDSLDFPWHICTAAREIEKWFVPQVVAHDAAGKEYTNATCRDIDLALDEDGFWLADITGSSYTMFFNKSDSSSITDTTGLPRDSYFTRDTVTGFFPIDDFEYLDDAKTVLNPKFDKKRNASEYMKPAHNYSFSMKISAQFMYIPGQYFEFRGDDDVWVFIDNRLVVDIGGCHSEIEGAVDLDTLGLEEGKEYPFQIFFSERNATGSNFKMRTSINLQTEKTYFPVREVTGDSTIKYEILQILTEENLTCDISSTGHVDTTAAPSLFILYGNSLPESGKMLEPGLNYGGIDISPDMAGFTINPAEIVRARALPPGSYCLYFSLADDPSQHSEVWFEVPEYPLPDIAFVDSLGGVFSPEGLNLLMQPMGGDGSNDTLMAFVAYPVRVAVVYMDEPCTDCVIDLKLETNDSLVFLDRNNQVITSVVSDSMGVAFFYVMGMSAINGGSFTVGGEAVNNKLIWENINMMEPPVPFASRGVMYDRNGDGIPDSLCIPFSEVFDEDVPDTLSWLFGDSSWHDYYGSENIRTLIRNGSEIVVEDEALLQTVFTGADDGVYQGSLKYHYTYWDEDKNDWIPLSMSGIIEDRIGAIVKSAIITPKTDDVSILSVIVSEGTDMEGLDIGGLFELKAWRQGVDSARALNIRSVSKTADGLRYDITFFAQNGLLPIVGDSIRLAPGVLPDNAGNVPHINNPWVKIIGGQRLQADAVNYAVIGLPEDPTVEPIRPMAVPMEWSIRDIEQQIGLPGYLLGYDLQELGLTAKSTTLDSVRIVWRIDYFSNLGQFVNSAEGVVKCTDAMFNGDCTRNPGKVFIAWDGRSDKRRLVGTGAYISKTDWKVYDGSERVGRKDETFTLGIKRSRVLQ